jgi:putative PIN family toxin of toxin-antitoxin system
MGKKVKVVLDSNVWLSILMKKSLSLEFSKSINEKATVYITQEILLEIAKALTYPRIAQVLEAAEIREKEILRAILANTTTVYPTLKLQVIAEDPEDNKILECSLAASANIIVTGDKHLLKIGKFRKIKILTPGEFLDQIA